MFTLPLHLFRILDARVPIHIWRVATAILIGIAVSLAFAGCQNQSITITDFSKTFKLTSPATRKAVVGLLLETDLNASAPIDMKIGCGGVVHARLKVQNYLKTSQRIDWYSDCAEVSFYIGGGQASSITVSYRFQTL